MRSPYIYPAHGHRNSRPLRRTRNAVYLSLLVPGLLAALLSASCRRDTAAEPDFEASRTVVPLLTEGETPQELLAGAIDGVEITDTPKVPLDPDESLLYVLDTNLDLDATDEQVVVLKPQGNADEPITIAVVDYDSVRNAYSRTWESPTRATNIRTFTIAFTDLVGDHNLEIVCRGMTSQGELTLDVFRKTPSPSGLGLFFTSICQIVTGGSIEIEEVERSEGYRLGQKNGPSFPIFAYTQDQDSANLLDLIKHSYYWQYQQNRYVLSSVEKLPGAEIEEQQLAELFSSTEVEPFEDYLKGPWYLASSEAKDELLLFLPGERKIDLLTGDVQEIYDWERSFRSLTNRLLIFANNESINTITKRILVEIKSSNTIDVTILGVGAEQWDRSSGRYVRLSEELQQDLVTQHREGASLTELELRGLYRSDEGIEIIFEPPYFTWLEPDRELSGGFSVFSLDRDILHLKAMDDNGLFREEMTFAIEQVVKIERDYIYRTLILTPVRLGVHGAQDSSEQRITFEQIEALKSTAAGGEDAADQAANRPAEE
jgi:hypothetical protein